MSAARNPAPLAEQLQQIEQFRAELENKFKEGELSLAPQSPLSRDEESAIDDLRFLCLRSNERSAIISDLRSLMQRHAKILLNME